VVRWERRAGKRVRSHFKSYKSSPTCLRAYLLSLLLKRETAIHINLELQVNCWFSQRRKGKCLRSAKRVLKRSLSNQCKAIGRASRVKSFVPDPQIVEPTLD